MGDEDHGNTGIGATHSMKTILVVEDDNLTRKVIEIRVKQILGDVDIEIATATDGNEALEKYQALKPKVVILDLVLPGINGFDIMVQIKDDIKSKKTIVVALSNLSGGQDMARQDSRRGGVFCEVKY